MAQGRAALGFQPPTSAVDQLQSEPNHLLSNWAASQGVAAQPALELAKVPGLSGSPVVACGFLVVLAKCLVAFDLAGLERSAALSTVVLVEPGQVRPIGVVRPDRFAVPCWTM